MLRLAALIFALATMTFLAACAPQAGGAAPPVAVETSTEPYKLDSGDRVRIDVFGQTDMSGEQTVDGSGMIAVPLLGQVDARGLTLEQLKGRIARQLENANLLVNPQVTVRVVGFRPFFILGEIRAPGQFAYVEGMTVLTAVAIAGGFTYRADGNSFMITRKQGEQMIETPAQRNTPVQPGDVIFVRERFF